MNTTLSHVTKGITAAFLLTALAACGGSGVGSSTSSTPTGTTSGTKTPVYALGSGSGTSAFKTNILTIGSTTLVAGGSTTVSVNLVDTANGSVIVTSLATNVTFTSPVPKARQRRSQVFRHRPQAQAPAALPKLPTRQRVAQAMTTSRRLCPRQQRPAFLQLTSLFRCWLIRQASSATIR